MSNDQGNQRLIAAGKVQRREVVKGVTAINMALPTASAVRFKADGKPLAGEFFLATLLHALDGCLWSEVAVAL